MLEVAGAGFDPKPFPLDRHGLIAAISKYLNDYEPGHALDDLSAFSVSRL